MILKDYHPGAPFAENVGEGLDEECDRFLVAFGEGEMKGGAVTLVPKSHLEWGTYAFF